MRITFIFLVILFATQAIAIEVDGVAVNGDVQAMPVSDIRSAIAKYDSGHARKLSEVTVVDKDHLHAYLDPRDLGWVTVTRTDYHQPDGSIRHGWDDSHVGLPEYSPALRLIQRAQAVYVFANTNPKYPHRDDKRMRLLDAKAREELRSLLDDREDWWQGLYTLGVEDKPATDIGLVFRDGDDELVLFFLDDSMVSGNLNGQFLNGLLNDGPSKRFKAWAAKYAQLELALPAETPPAWTRMPRAH